MIDVRVSELLLACAFLTEASKTVLYQMENYSDGKVTDEDIINAINQLKQSIERAQDAMADMAKWEARSNAGSL